MQMQKQRRRRKKMGTMRVIETKRKTTVMRSWRRGAGQAWRRRQESERERGVGCDDSQMDERQHTRASKIMRRRETALMFHIVLEKVFKNI